MNVHFFGTAASEGWPALFCDCKACKRAKALGHKNIRTRAGALIDNVIKLDFGPDTYMQALRDSVDLSQLQHFLFTHTHEDHFVPTSFLFYQSPYAWKHPRTVYLYGNEKVTARAYSEIRQLHNGTKFEFITLSPFETISIEGIRVTPLLADHDPAETCLIYLFEKDGKSLLWGHDTGFFPEETWLWLEQHANTTPLTAVVLDCTSGDSKDMRGHMGMYANGLVKDRLIQHNIADDSTRFIATHFSHNIKLMHHELERLLSRRRIAVAYDGMQLTM